MKTSLPSFRFFWRKSIKQVFSPILEQGHIRKGLILLLEFKQTWPCVCAGILPWSQEHSGDFLPPPRVGTGVTGRRNSGLSPHGGSCRRKATLFPCIGGVPAELASPQSISARETDDPGQTSHTGVGILTQSSGSPLHVQVRQALIQWTPALLCHWQSTAFQKIGSWGYQ